MLDRVPAGTFRLRLCGRRRIAVLVILTAFVVVPCAAAWQSVNYWTQPLFAGQSVEDQTQASRQYNKVWRTAGLSFGLSYSTSSWVFNTWSNPFVDNRTAFYAKAACLNNSGSEADPVTCQSTYP